MKAQVKNQEATRNKIHGLKIIHATYYVLVLNLKSEWYAPCIWQLIQPPSENTYPVGQKHPSTHPPLQSTSLSMSHLWGQTLPHC